MLDRLTARHERLADPRRFLGAEIVHAHELSWLPRGRHLLTDPTDCATS